MNNFKDILENEWSQLIEATQTAKHPFHHFTLSNSSNNKPESRTIILRHTLPIERKLGFNTDRRSPKFSSLLSNNHIAALFYDIKRKIQLRIIGKVFLNKEENRKKIWDKMALESKLCYMGKFAPSTIIKEYEPNIPLQKITEISKEEYNLGFTNFINFEIIIDSIDWLFLHSNGHKRIRYEWKKNKLSANWLAT